jgi:hypothetical protein
MNTYYNDGAITIFHGDSGDLLPLIPSNPLIFAVPIRHTGSRIEDASTENMT